MFESIPVPARKIFKGTEMLSVFRLGGSYFKVFEIEAQLESNYFQEESSWTASYGLNRGESFWKSEKLKFHLCL